MSVPISITEDDLVEDLGAFADTLVDCEVVRGQVNRVPSPKGDFVVVTPAGMVGLSLPVTAYADPTPGTGTRTLTRPTQWAAQVDCYGERAQDRALVLSIALRSQYGCEFLGELGRSQPLYTGEPRQMPLVTGEDQYMERWSFDAVLQFNPSITLPQQFAEHLHVDLVEVDEKYPPGA
ncbi:hypothetical protein GHR37_27440 [Achromobacter xylosoxidans]|nr:hypothetical protein [Achromobacter xylosoxidans]